MKISFQIFLILIYQTVCEELNPVTNGFCMKNNLENEHILENCAKKCLEFDQDGPSVFVKDSTGRLGNHMFTYMTLMAIRLRFGLPIYLAKRSYNMMSTYFHRLEIEPAEDHLCGFDKVYKNFSSHVREQKMDNIMRMIERKLERKIEWERDERGRVIVPAEYAENPKIDVDGIVHSKEFDLVSDIQISQKTSYPWIAYNESIEGIGDETTENNLLRGKAVILFPPAPTDFEYVNDTPGLTEKLDRGFQFRPEYMTLAQKTLADVVKKHLAKQKNEKKKKKKKNKELTFVGIHSRRTDHVKYDSLLGNQELTPTYYLDAMQMYRDFYGNVIFLYISDDLDWGKRKIGTKREAAKDLYFVGEGQATAENSIGHDLALMSMCNHTIISHGTFSFWAGFLAGGKVISPNHFKHLRPKNKAVHGYDGHPLKEPIHRLHFH